MTTVDYLTLDKTALTKINFRQMVQTTQDDFEKTLALLLEPSFDDEWKLTYDNTSDDFDFAVKATCRSGEFSEYCSLVRKIIECTCCYCNGEYAPKDFQNNQQLYNCEIIFGDFYTLTNGVCIDIYLPVRQKIVLREIE